MGEATTERILEEVELEITNFEEEYEGEKSWDKWEKVKEKMEMMGGIGWWAFCDCYDLLHITLHPDVEVDRCAFINCFSLEVLAASTNFEIDTGDKTPSGYNDPTRGITSYLKWRNESDAARKEQMYTYMVMTELCFVDEDDPNPPPARAEPNDPISKFLVERCMGDTGIGRRMLSFFGETRGKGDLRGAFKAELLAVGLELKILMKESNQWNQEYWGVKVNKNGEIIGPHDVGWWDDEEFEEESDNDDEGMSLGVKGG
jgi:hypothetical protein